MADFTQFPIPAIEAAADVIPLTAGSQDTIKDKLDELEDLIGDVETAFTAME